MIRAVSLSSCVCVLASVAFAQKAPVVESDGDLPLLQGKWEVAWAIGLGTFPLGVEYSPESQKAADLLKAMGSQGFAIKGNSLTVGGDETGSAALDASFSRAEERKVLSGRTALAGRLLRIVLPSGQAFVTSYHLDNRHNLTVRYPAGACSRSGTVIQLTRATQG